LSTIKRRFYPSFFPKKRTRLLYFLELVRSGASFAKELGRRIAALGDEHVGAGVEVVKRVDMIGGGVEGRGKEDGDVARLDRAEDRRLVDSGEVGMDNTEATKGRHSGSHGTFSDDVHKGGKDRGEERNLTCGEGDGVVISFLTVHLPTFFFFFFFFFFCHSGVMGVSVGLVTI
jgi:hypothetical protein